MQRVVWDVQVVMRDDVPVTESPFTAVLSQIPDGHGGSWPRLTAMDPTSLATVAMMWASRVCMTPAGATADGIDTLDTHRRVRWLLRNPRPSPERSSPTLPEKAPEWAWMMEI